MRTWIITDGRKGTENNALGLAEALGLTAELRPVSLRPPWKYLSPWLRLGLGYGVKGMAAPWPDITISAGRTPAVGALYVKQCHPATKTIHITSPGIAPRHFNLVIAPQHDHLSGTNVVVTTGALHRVNESKLNAAAAEWQPRWQHLPRPWHGVLVGGDAHGMELTPPLIARWMQYFQSLHGSLIVTTSRRTPPAMIKMLRDRLHGPHHIVWSGEADGPNPYMGILALADTLFVTSESVNMASEAASTGKPVYLLPLDGTNRKLDAFATSLISANHARPLTALGQPFTPQKLDDMSRAVTAVKGLLNL